MLQAVVYSPEIHTPPLLYLPITAPYIYMSHLCHFCFRISASLKSLATFTSIFCDLTGLKTTRFMSPLHFQVPIDPTVNVALNSGMDHTLDNKQVKRKIEPRTNPKNKGFLS